MQQRLEQYSDQKPLREHLGVQYPFQGILNSADSNYEFPLTRQEDTLSLAAECHLQLRSRIMSHHLDDATLPGSEKTYATFRKLKDMLARRQEWRPLHMAQDTAYNHSQETRRAFVSDLLRQSAADNDLDLLYDVRFVSETSLFCPDTSKISDATTQTFDGHENMTVWTQTNINNNVGEEVEQMRGWDFGFTNKAVGNIEHLCPCANNDTRYGTLCELDAAVCAIKNLDEHNCFDEACDGALSEGDNGKIQYSITETCTASHIRDFLHTHSERLRNKNFVCESFLPSNLWGLNMGGNSNRYPSLQGLFMLKNGVSVTNVLGAVQNAKTHLHEGRREVKFSSSNDPDGETKASNILCDKAELNPQRVAKYAFPAVSFVPESHAVVTCTAYIMESSYGDFLEEVAGDQNIVAQVRDAIGLVRARTQTLKRKCESLLNRLETCQVSGAFDQKIVREVSSQSHTASCCDNVNYVVSEIDASNAATYCIRHECAVAVISKTVQYFDLAKCGTEASGQIKLRDACRRTAPPCPFTMAGDDTIEQYSFLPAPCLVVEHTSTERDVFYDPILCVSSQADLEDPVTMYKSWFSERCKVNSAQQLLAIMHEGKQGVEEIPSLSRKYVEAVLGNEKSELRTGFFGTRVDEDWWDPPTRNDTWFAMPTIPYWPSGWQGAPHGELLTDRTSPASGQTFSTYMAFIEDVDEPHFAVLPDHLRFENHSTQVFGSSGYCREPTWGMPMELMNYNRLCITESDTVVSESKLCTDSSSAQAGGLMHQSLGHWWGLLFPFLDEDFNLRDQEDGVARDNLFNAEYSKSYIVPEHGRRIEDVVETFCQGSYSVHSEGGHTPTHHCYLNSDCEKNEVCSGDTGKCLEVEIEFENFYSHDIEIGVHSEHCDGQGKNGASPYENIQGLLQLHGMCAHKNYVNYRYLLQRARADTEACQRYPLGDEDEAYYECTRDAIFYWITQTPQQLPEDAQPGVFAENIDASSDEEKLRKMSENGLFQLEPSACDYEYAVDSDKLKWCTLRAHSHEPALITKWMRTNRFDEDTFVFMDEESLLDEVYTDMSSLNSYAETDLLKNKLRFMGLDEHAIDVNPTRAHTIMQECGHYGVCQEIFLEIAGHRLKRRKASKENVELSSDMRYCHSFGYVQSGSDCGRSSDQCTCVLDKHVNSLFYTLYAQEHKGECSFIKPRAVPGELGLNFNSSNREWTYPGAQTYEVEIFLKSLFFYTEGVIGPDTARKIAIYRQVHTCGEFIQNHLHSLETIENLYDDKKISVSVPLDEDSIKERTVKKLQGVYYFYRYAAHEMPLMWFLKLKWYSLFYNTKIMYSEFTNNIISLPSFDDRMSLVNLVGSADSMKVRDIWSRTTLRADALATDNVVSTFSKVFGRVYANFLMEVSNISYAFRQPKTLSLSRPTVSAVGDYKDDYETFGMEDFMKMFENIAHEIHHSGNNDTANKSVWKHMNPFQDKMRPDSEYNTPFLSRIVKSKDITADDMKPMYSEELPVWNAIDSNHQSWFELVIANILNAETTVYDPFDAQTGDMKANDVIHQGGEGDDDPMLLLATFTIPDIDIEKKNMHDKNAEVLEEFSEENEVHIPHDLDKNVIADNDAEDRQPYEKDCIYSKDYYESMFREAETYGIITDSNPYIDIKKDGETDVISRIWLCAPEYNNDFREYHTRGDVADGMPCNLNNDATKDYVDFDHQSIPPTLSKNFRLHGSVNSNEHNEHKLSTGTDRRRLLDPSRPVSVAGAFYRARNPAPGKRPNEFKFEDTRALCHRLDLQCVTQGSEQNKNTLWGTEKDWKDDTYERIKHHAYTQAAPEALRDFPCEDNDDSCDEAKTTFATMMPEAFATTMTEGVPQSSQKLFRHHVPRSNPAITNANIVLDHIADSQDMESGRFKLNYYKINDDFKHLIRDKQHGLGILTSKDRLYTEIPRKTSGGATGQQWQPAFGHFEQGRGDKKKKVLASPGYSFCPGLLHSNNNNDDFKYLHYYKIVNYADVTNARLNTNIYNANIPNSHFGVGPLPEFTRKQDKNDDYKFSKRNLNEEQYESLKERTYDQDYDLSEQNSALFTMNKLLIPDTCASSVAPSSCNATESHFWTKIRELLFTKFSFSSHVSTPNFTQPVNMWSPTMTPRLMNPMIHNREARVNRTGTFFVRQDNYPSPWPVMFPWKRRGRRDVVPTPDPSALSYFFSDNSVKSWQNLDYLLCMPRDVADLYPNGLQLPYSQRQIDLVEHVAELGRHGWCPRYSGTRILEGTPNCLTSDAKSGHTRNAHNTWSGDTIFHAGYLMPYSSGGSLGMDKKKLVCEKSEQYQEPNKFDFRLSVDLRSNECRGLDAGDSNVDRVCFKNADTGEICEFSTAVFVSTTADSSIYRPFRYSHRKVQIPTYTSFFRLNSYYNLGPFTKTLYDSWTQMWPSLSIHDETKEEEEDFQRLVMSETISAVLHKTRDFFEQISCELTSSSDLNEHPFYTSDNDDLHWPISMQSRKCRGVETNPGEKRQSGSITWPFVTGWGADEFPHVARMNWEPNHHGFSDAQTAAKRFFSDYIQHDYYMPIGTNNKFSDSQKSYTDADVKVPHSTGEEDYSWLTKGDSFKIEAGLKNFGNKMHHHFQFLPNPIERGSKTVNEVAHVISDTEVVRFTEDVVTRAERFKDYTMDGDVVEYTRARLDAHAGRSPSALAQRAGEKPAPSSTPSSKPAPCNLPQLIAEYDNFDMNYLELANCYEQDVHEVPDWRPWWTYSTCDMGRGILDETTNFHALADWLGWDIPQHFTLNFLTDFVSTFVNAMYMGYYETSPDPVRGGWVPFEFEGIHEDTFKRDGTRLGLDYWERLTRESMENHFQERDEFYMQHGMSKAPRHSGKSTGTDFWHYLFGNQITPSPGTGTGGNWVPLQLTAKMLGDPPNPMNSFVRYMMTDNDHCKINSDSEAVFTKPTKWSEIDGTAGEHLVACDPNVDGFVNCKPLIEKVIQPRGPDDIIVAYSIEQGDFFCANKEYPDFASTEENRHKMPFWVNDISEERNTPNEGLWVERECKKYEKNRPFLNLKRDRKITMMSGLWKTTTNSSTFMTRTHDDMLNDLKDDHHGFDRLMKKDDSELERILNTQLDELYGDGVYKIKRTAGRTFNLLLNYLPLESKVNSTDKKIRREYEKYFINQSIVDSFLSMGAGAESQYCKLDSEPYDSHCWGARYNAQTTITQNNNVEENINRNCQSNIDIEGSDALASFYSNFTLLHKLEFMKDHILKEKYGLDVHKVKAGNGKSRTFGIRDNNFSWVDDGIHVFASKHSRQPSYKFLDNLLDKRSLQQSWSETATTAKTCFVSPDEKIWVANPWFGGNYTFPNWFKFLNPRDNKFYERNNQKEVRRYMTGFDMCPSHKQGPNVGTASEYFSWSSIWPCFASDCVDYDPAVQLLENNTHVSLCEKMYTLFNDKSRDNVTWPTFELLQRNLQASMVLFENEEYFLTSMPNHDVCNELPGTGRSQCHHRQTVIGRDLHESSASFQRATNFKGQKMGGRIRKQVFTLHPNMNRTLWNSKTVSEVLGDNLGSTDAFTLLMDPLQTGPRVIQLSLTNAFRLYVKKILLTKPEGTLEERWQEQVSERMKKDEATIRNSKLYNGASKQAARNRNWICSLLKIDLFSFHDGLYDHHKTLRLLTPDPVKMKEKYPSLSGMHPMVKTETLHDKITYSRRSLYRRLGPAFLFQDTEDGALRQETWRKARLHLHDFIYDFVLGRQQLPFSDVHHNRTRHKVPDWPNIAKQMRSGQTHTPEALIDRVNLFAMNTSFYKVEMDTAEKTGSTHLQNTHAEGGDCYRNSTIVFTTEELHRVLEFDVCYQMVEDPEHLKCSKAGHPTYTYLELRRSEPMVSRNDTDMQATFASPLIVEPIHIGTKRYVGESSEVSENELSLSSRFRLSPQYRVWMRLQHLQLRNQMSWTDVETKWSNTEGNRLAHARWKAVQTFENTTNSYFVCDDGRKLDIGSGLSASERQLQCARHMAQQSCSAFPSVAVDICQLSLFRDYCKILAEWTSDVMRLLAAENGRLSVRRQVYVPSMFHMPTSSFVHQHVRSAYEGIDDVTGANICPARVSSAETLRRDSECPANFYAQLINTLGLLHDFGLQIWDFVVEMQELVEEFLMVLLGSIIESVVPGTDTIFPSFASVPQLFSKMVNHLIRLVNVIVSMCDQMFNALWEMIKAAPFWDIIEDIINDICEAVNDIIGWVESTINDLIGAINSAGGFLGISLDIPDLALGALECELTLNFITDVFQAEDVSVSSTFCYGNIPSVQSFDEFGSTGGSCRKTSFCVNDVFDSSSVIKCGECEGQAYHCDLMVKSCKCGMVLDAEPKPCTNNGDCQGSAQCSMVNNPWASTFVTLPCSKNDGLVVCLRKPTSAIADIGFCATLRQHSMQSFPDCNSEIDHNDEITTALRGGFCLVVNGDMESAYRFEDLAVLPCHELIGHTRGAKCASVTTGTMLQEPATSIIVMQYSSTRSTGRRLLGADSQGSTMVLEFLDDNIGRVSGTDSSCLADVASCYEHNTLTSACMSCARLWWLWNSTLHGSGYTDVDFMDYRHAFISVVTNKTLGRAVLGGVPECTVRLVHDWVGDESVWKALAIMLPQVMGGHWFHTIRRGVHELNKFHAVLHGSAAHNSSRHGRKLMQEDGHRQFFGTPPDVNASVLARKMRTYYKNNSADLTLKLEVNITEAQRPLQCSRNSYTFNGNFLVRFQKLLSLNGFRPRVQCDEMQYAESEKLGTCPLLMVPFLQVVKDTATLLEYYAHMQDSGCLYNSKISCLKTSTFKAASIIQVIPKIASADNTSMELLDDTSTSSQGIVLFLVLKIGNYVLDIFEPLFGDSRGHLVGFLNLNAFKNTTLFHEMTRTNTWDLGRLVREFTECNFEEILHCNRVRSPLPMTIAGIFIFVVTLHIFVPIHPVVSFLIWTGALTWGVPFLAYGFSPLCMPRVPVCYASDIHDFINWIVPTRMDVPRNLYNQSCSAHSKMAADSDCFLSCSNAQIRVHDAPSILYMIEPACTKGGTTITLKVRSCLPVHSHNTLTSQKTPYMEDTKQPSSSVCCTD